MRDRVATIDEQFYPPLEERDENRIYPAPDGGLAVFQSSVTAKKEVEERLRRSEGYLAEGQRLTHTGSWAWNVSTGDLFWSDEHFRICGLDPDKEQPIRTQECTGFTRMIARWCGSPSNRLSETGLTSSWTAAWSGLTGAFDTSTALPIRFRCRRPPC